jgi:hypothetical protein
MYGHPRVVKQWAKALKPPATPSQFAQAALMRRAKAARKRFDQKQGKLF